MALRTKLDFEVLMLRRGLSRRSRAADLGVTDQAVCDALKGRTRTQRLRNHIAEKLNVPLGRLAGALEWPDAPGRKPSPAKEAVA